MTHRAPCPRHPHYRGEKGSANCRRCRAIRHDVVQAAKVIGAQPGSQMRVEGDHAELSASTPSEVRSLEDLIRVCKIDTNVWEIERWVCNKWDMGFKDKASTARALPVFQIKAWLKRRVSHLAALTEIDALKVFAKRGILRRPTTATPRPSTGYMLELNIPDLHVGKLAWGKETGHEDYDADLAWSAFDTALEALLTRTSSYTFDRVLIVIGNDLLHSDTKAGTTTAGTQMDTDSRFHRNFGKVRQMMTTAIERSLKVAPRVDITAVPGNHDSLSVWHLADSLECYFHQEPRVTIDNAPTMRKYYQFGKVMLMFTHGNTGKLSDYPLLMATEKPQMFGETWHREAHTGDKHQLRVQEHHGVRVRILPALCPPDAWHSEKQFVGMQRSAEAFVWHEREGLVGTAVYTVTPREEVA